MNTFLGEMTPHGPGERQGLKSGQEAKEECSAAYEVRRPLDRTPWPLEEKEPSQMEREQPEGPEEAGRSPEGCQQGQAR